MKKRKPTVILYGSLMCPLAIGKAALLQSGGKLYHTSRVVAIPEQKPGWILFETVNTVYRVNTAPFPHAALSLRPAPLAACA